MRRSKLFATFAAVVAVALFGFAGAAHADPADDAAIMAENLPAAVEELVAGIEAAADTYAETSSAVETSEVLGDGVVDAGSALVMGTEQFGALGFGFSLLNNAVQNAAAPYLGAIDDPSTAGDLINPDDLSTILDQLPAAADTVQPHVVSIVVLTLSGDLFNAAGEGVLLAADVLGVLFNTNFETVVPVVGIPLLVGVIAGQEYIVQVQDGLAPAFEALDPATAPIIEALEGL